MSMCEGCKKLGAYEGCTIFTLAGAEWRRKRNYCAFNPPMVATAKVKTRVGQQKQRKGHK